MTNRCNRCNLLLPNAKKVLGKGTIGAKLMFIGEAPGDKEVKSGKPFAGESEKLLNRLFEKAGIKHENIYITNACKCRFPNNRPPNSNEVKNCLSELKEEIRLINPYVIVALGKTALYALSILYNIEIDHKISNMVKKILYTGQQYVIPAYHPMFLLQHPDVKYKYDTFVSVKKALSLLSIMENQQMRQAMDLIQGCVIDIQEYN